MTDRFLTPRLAGIGLALVLVVLLAFVGIIVASAARGLAPGLLLLRQLAPMPFFLFALVASAIAIRRIGEGQALGGLLSPLLRRIGWALFLGGIAQVFIVPQLTRQGPGGYAWFDVNAITLGAIGVTLVIVARLVGDAERDRAELDAIL